jgi:hypothetical protein
MPAVHLNETDRAYDITSELPGGINEKPRNCCSIANAGRREGRQYRLNRRGEMSIFGRQNVPRWTVNGNDAIRVARLVTSTFQCAVDPGRWRRAVAPAGAHELRLEECSPQYTRSQATPWLQPQ